ncbi:2,5-dichloro-2,5-cyclohexadiene-1,4-diol dehydrogenase [Stemphylium lycopersici]|uniref:2,5-dichloro-2,5-cyclohexadiene-1,4-diol dehydrogenase n=1 Tax=Stemphylium lycopersici TaxID=183478 RepID=A0A364N1Q6_STELY|nr:2,5-dichloro-2,5-cyclohexadiene-1,4-diol dehydrogenase [Stemphylium lycopersici]RAR09685.1 2,5-dichloro-2,5-cyclohexadiene-1,4-diol dehydrogenase [Stemphylium lycopersici]RAR10334.1 2,5-dichloro-2,5-cyclohexadiene-1,4-diol dehydrogenase [Stemphylium lycopersici]
MGQMKASLPYAVNPLPFSGKFIAVTGASRGLGLALCKYLLIRGAAVSMYAKDRYRTWTVDIANLDSVRSWIEETVAQFGKLDGAANVAAVEQREIFPITDLDPEYFARLLNVNVVGTFHCLKEEMKFIKDGGSIVNVGSIASQYATYGTSAYVAAKHALIGLTKVAAFEGAPRRVRVNAMCPGCFNTPMMTEPFNSPAGQFHLNKDNIPCILNRPLPETWEIAGSIAFLLGDEAAHVTKASWYVDGGWVESNYSSG